MAPTVAIIIPVLNERMLIIDALHRASCLGADEIIVVDGNSTDGTYELVKERFPYVRCLKTVYANRALQINVGAKEALSDILIFLHADMKLAVHSIERIKQSIQLGNVGGGFMKRYEPSNVLLNIYGFLINYIYLGVYRNLVGSNAIFIKRDTFESLKGFPEVDFMEDVVFSNMLKESGKVAVIDEPVTVSSRRYQQNGVLKQMMRNAKVMIGYSCLHQSPQELKKVYAAHV